MASRIHGSFWFARVPEAAAPTPLFGSFDLWSDAGQATFLPGTL